MEALVVLAIIGTLAGLAIFSLNIIHVRQLDSAKAQLLTDLKRLRVDAVTVSSACSNPPHSPTHSYSHTRGFGLRFITDKTYSSFRFEDLDDDYAYKNDHTEAIENYRVTLDGGCSVTRWDSGEEKNPVSNSYVRIYDNRGFLRKTDWSTAAEQTYIIRHPKVAQAKCVVIDAVNIREGIWNASAATKCGK